MYMAENLIGDKFGRLIVLKRASNRCGQRSAWLCKCDCGNQKIRTRSYLLGQDNKSSYMPIRSCGCVRKKIETPDFKVDLSGLRFGRLVVLRFDHKPYWLCKCDCGNEKSVLDYNLISGATKSCGCLSKEVLLRGLKPGDAGFNKLLRTYLHGSKQRKINFNLSLEQFRKLVTGNCFYCGEKPSQEVKVSSEYSTFIYNGIDRVDNAKGYEIENTVSCCSVCNRMKNVLNAAVFVEWCKKVAKHVF